VVTEKNIDFVADKKQKNTFVDWGKEG